MHDHYAMLLKDGTYYIVPWDLLVEMRALYTNADAQIQRLVNWCADARNAYKRKTRRGCPEFIRRNLRAHGAVRYRNPVGAPLPARDAQAVHAQAQKALNTCRAMIAAKLAAKPKQSCDA